MFICFDRMYERDRQTPHNDMGCACIEAVTGQTNTGPVTFSNNLSKFGPIIKNNQFKSLD